VLPKLKSNGAFKSYSKKHFNNKWNLQEAEVGKAGFLHLKKCLFGQYEHVSIVYKL